MSAIRLLHRAKHPIASRQIGGFQLEAPSLEIRLPQRNHIARLPCNSHHLFSSFDRIIWMCKYEHWNKMRSAILGIATLMMLRRFLGIAREILVVGRERAIVPFCTIAIARTE